MPFVTRAVPPEEASGPNVTVPTTVSHLASPFTPAHWICTGCKDRVPILTNTCPRKSCPTSLTWSCTLLDQRDRVVNPARFPVHWMCSSCFAPHLVVEILLRKVACSCGKPALQAVWDQFGDLFLFWERDEGIYDLTVSKKVEEAAGRLWEAGGDRWVDEMPVITMREKVEEEVKVEEQMILSGMAVMVDITA